MQGNEGLLERLSEPEQEDLLRLVRDKLVR